MMVSVETVLLRGQRQLRRLLLRPDVLLAARFLGCLGSGFFLSAAGLAHAAQPLAMGFCCAQPGWRAWGGALGSILGYRFFWGTAGTQGMVWAGLGALAGLLPCKREDPRFFLMISAGAAFLVSGTGLAAQLFFRDTTPFGVYLLRVCMGAAAPLLYIGRRHPLRRWLMAAVWVLALARVGPTLWCSAGVAAFSLMARLTPFPAAVLAGFALDLARITPLSMTALGCASCLVGHLAGIPRWLRWAVPAGAALVLMPLLGSWDLYLLPPLLLGGGLAEVFPPRPALRPSTATGAAQVRLETAAAVMTRLQQLLLEQPEEPIDEKALLEKARLRSCGSCTLAAACRERTGLTVAHLHRPTDFACRRPAKIQIQLQLCREQLYLLRTNRSHLREYRSALEQQYRFLAGFLREAADQLPRNPDTARPRFRVKVSSRCRSKEPASGDRCCAFPGSRCRYYVLLCDGMGTGLGAADQAQTTLELLRKLLTAGFPPEHALGSINSLLALRGQAGAVTLDLAELRLDTGKALVYKWGAAPSGLLGKGGLRILGSGSPPPGIHMNTPGETVLRLSLDRGQTLFLLSDGVCIGPNVTLSPELPPRQLAQELLARCAPRGGDDATVVAIRLEPVF